MMEALPETKPEKLRFLAKYFDAKYPDDDDTEVQDNLRAWADEEDERNTLRAENTELKTKLAEAENEYDCLETAIQYDLINRDTLAQAAARIAELEAEVSDDQSALQNLMAVINRDGGHGADDFDTPKEAAEHCESTVVGLFAEVERLREGVNAVHALIAESERVIGLHLNGEVAPWADLQTGGRFEEWLLPLDEALEPPNDKP